MADLAISEPIAHPSRLVEALRRGGPRLWVGGARGDADVELGGEAGAVSAGVAVAGDPLLAHLVLLVGR